MKRAGWLVMGLVAWGALAFGAVYPWAYWPLAIGSGALGVWMLVTTHARRHWQHAALTGGLIAIAVGIALQLVPLPYLLFAQLSPAADRFFREYQLSYASPAWHSLSIDPASTAVTLLLFLAFALFAIGLVHAMPRLSLERLVRRLMVLGVILSVIGVVQKAAMPRELADVLIYGFWKTQSRPNPFGPFVNRNHFAGWVVMTLPLVVAYAYGVVRESIRHYHGNWRRVLHWSATPEASKFGLIAFSGLAMAAALVASGSRTGVISFVVAMAILALFMVRQSATQPRRLLAPALLVVLLVGAIGWAGVDATVKRFSRASVDVTDRFAAWHDTTRIIGDSPIFGTGLGTYGQVMLVYQTGDRETIFHQAHNDYLQIVAEGGLLVGLPAFASVILLVQGIRRRVASDPDDRLTTWIRRGAVAGLVGIAAQSAAEFSLQMPGNVVLFAVLLAVALHRAPDVRHNRG